MALSQQTVVSDGTLATLALTVQYNTQADISVYFNDVLTPLSDGLWHWLSPASATIVFTPVVAATVVVKVVRTTSVIAIDNDFTAGAVFSAQALDDNFTQLLYAIQEVEDTGMGLPGVRGTVNIAEGGHSAWTDTLANAALVAAGYGHPIYGDVVTLYNSAVSTTKVRSASAWVPQAAYLSPNVLLPGNLAGNSFTGGIGAFSNSNAPTSPAVVAYTTGNSANPDNIGVYGIVDPPNLQSNAAGLAGWHKAANKKGVVGTPTNAFYALAGTYAPFTGSHDFVMGGADATSAVPGDIVYDVECVGAADISNTIFRVAPAVGVNLKGASGVLESIYGPLSNYQPVGLSSGATEGALVMGEYWHSNADKLLGCMNAVGEGQINVCGQGGNLARGDLIAVSDMLGKGMRQEDDIVHGYTVARARSDITFDSPDQVKLVPCIYMCG